MQNLITFNDIPQLMVDVLAKLKELDEKMDRLAPSVKADEPQWFNVSALIDYLPNHPAEQTIYGWTSAKKIPFHKRGKSILFNKAEIDEWLNDSTHHKSVQELERDAMSYISSKRNGVAKKGGWR
ncbi:MAG: helix-turn-helix domain-containing protein [Prevotella sp.]|jgi:excisionase family DNA binding protein|nr:helix-turn-helix domain-containing protein [Prevotella sp.]